MTVLELQQSDILTLENSVAYFKRQNAIRKRDAGRKAWQSRKRNGA